MTTRHSGLVQRVSASLKDDPRTGDGAIDVVDENGIITLKGTVPSAEALDAAEEIAKQQEGVIQVVNELQIEADDEDKNVVVVPPRHEVH